MYMKELVVGIGELVWDVFPEGKRLGGAPANFAYHVKQFGVPSVMVSAIDHDEMGVEMLRKVESLGLDANLAVVDAPTGRVEVTRRPDGQPDYDIVEGSAWDNIPFENKCWALLGKYALKILILTCGEKGSYVFTPGHMTFEPTPKVKLADTVGAGDSFTAAFFASLLKGATIRDAHKKAVDTAAFVCTQSGAMPTLPPELLK